MAHACLGRGVHPHCVRAHPKHHRASARAQRKEPMNEAAEAIRATTADVGAAATPAAIDIRDLNFYYGKSHALKHVNMAVPANSVTAIIGPSGCGKSTLLRTINRIYEMYPDQYATGEI